MRTLRLIKPWHLRTVRLRLEDVRELVVEHTAINPVPVTGPVACAEDVWCRNADCAERMPVRYDEASTSGRPAPHSDVMRISHMQMIPR